MRARSLVALVILLVAACGSSAPQPSQFGDSASFASNDSRCPSVRLSNEADDQEVLTAAIECFFDEYDAGRAVTVDFDIPTVEGDSIYHRYRYDGETVLIVEDTRADEYGTGYIRARSCERVEGTDWLPEGYDCSQVAHPGFPEAA